MRNKSKKKAQHLLIIGSVWPEPDSSAAGKRMMQLISLFQSEGWRITFASSATETEHMVNLQCRDIEKGSIRLNNPEFDDYIKELQPTVVMFDRFIIEEQYGWRVSKYCPNALRILDTEDLHCLRRIRHKAMKQNTSFIPSDLLSEEVAKREVASIFRSDLSLIISEAEMQLLQDTFHIKTELLHYIPFLLDSINAKSEQWPLFEERSHFVTVGNFRHDPNRDAVYYLKEDIWPLIRRKLPKAELHIFGAYPSNAVQQLHQPNNGFFIKGRVENVKDVVRQSKVSLAPLRFGAGLKGKLVEAMKCGTPSVTTDIGAEGINAGFEWSGIIKNNPKEIAAAAVELYTNQAAWKEAQEKGIKIINKRFDKNIFGPGLIEKVLDLQKHLQDHRRHNFTGAMMMHHTMAASKYMSRWIEAKNKLTQEA